MCKNKCKIKTCYTSSKEISDYKKTMERTFVKYFKSYIKNKPSKKNNVY